MDYCHVFFWSNGSLVTGPLLPEQPLIIISYLGDRMSCSHRNTKMGPIRYFSMLQSYSSKVSLFPKWSIPIGKISLDC